MNTTPKNIAQPLKSEKWVLAPVKAMIAAMISRMAEMKKARNMATCGRNCTINSQIRAIPKVIAIPLSK